MVSTNIPSSEVDRFASLALKAKGQKISTLSLVPPMINTADPDIKLIRVEGRRRRSTRPRARPPHRARHKAARTGTVTGGSLGSLSSGYAANESADLGAAC